MTTTLAPLDSRLFNAAAQLAPRLGLTAGQWNVIAPHVQTAVARYAATPDARRLELTARQFAHNGQQLAGFWDEFIDENWFFSRNALNVYDRWKYGAVTPPPAPAAPTNPAQTWTPEQQTEVQRQQVEAWRQTAIPDPKAGPVDYLNELAGKLAGDWKTYAVIVAAIIAGYLALKVTTRVATGGLIRL